MAMKSLKLEGPPRELSAPELALWRAVVYLAIDDACTRSTGGKTATTRLQCELARDWLLTDSRDFRRVCELALLDPDAVRERAEQLQRDGWPPNRRQGRSQVERETAEPRRRIA